MKIHILGLNVEDFFIYDKWYMGPPTGTRTKCHSSDFENLSLPNFDLVFFFFFPLRGKGNERDSGMIDIYLGDFHVLGEIAYRLRAETSPGDSTSCELSARN